VKIWLPHTLPSFQASSYTTDFVHVFMYFKQFLCGSCSDLSFQRKILVRPGQAMPQLFSGMQPHCVRHLQSSLTCGRVNCTRGAKLGHHCAGLSSLVARHPFNLAWKTSERNYAQCALEDGSGAGLVSRAILVAMHQQASRITPFHNAGNNGINSRRRNPGIQKA